MPKHKDDQRVIAGLKKLSFEQLEPIIPDLLEWLQDMNWPIARPVADILKPFADRLVPYIIRILKTDDGEWKAWILGTFARNTENSLLLSELKRIAKFPSRDEIDCEVNLDAISILNEDYK
ncbi:DUF5071 domain-containing protein [Mucilaginibacter sp. cycad4]|uniref:DUF5071 domain-containing protein n=1 Tax=Mucilaginibacter sp. cycad4 TaxID=3342096 RepID=UPI002AAC18E8|nr:DUF5071 domain-containing protein [Mucilaginibacter gossypii]WPV02318.1 DUF5071 domain-containing protein [Mucilaginibacter gossypii]